HPESNSGITAQADLLAARLVSDVRLTLLALLGAVGCLLLLACVNVANLLVARGVSRQPELAVRAALGGGRLRLVSQLLVESLLVSAVGAALGVAIASWLLRALIAVAPEGTPRIEDVRLDGAAVAFALAAAAVSGLVFGAFPAFQASGIRGQQAVGCSRSAGRAGTRRPRPGPVGGGGGAAP